MSNFGQRMTVTFSAGCLGGLINSLALWLIGQAGITAQFGVKLTPSLSTEWLYPRIVWGGIWGFLFLFPLLRSDTLLQGLLLSLGPTLVQLFIVFPIQTGKGLMGFDLGNLTPLFVLFFNAIWGICTAFWLKFIQENAGIGQMES